MNARRQAVRAIDPDNRAIEHGISDDAGNKIGEFVGMPEAVGKGHLRAEPRLAAIFSAFLTKAERAKASA